MTVTEASAPGKLFIAGEYAVVTPGHPSILVALDQFITVSLEEADTTGTIRSAQYGGLPIPWTREEDQLVIDQRENPFLYITEAVKVTERYIKETGVPLSYFHLSVKSELDNASGKKYGLGSSGAVTVATIKALLKFYAIDPDFELVYKLAALAHLSVKSNGSFGDIAASTYGGWIAYACFDREWVMKQGSRVDAHRVVGITLAAIDDPALDTTSQSAVGDRLDRLAGFDHPSCRPRQRCPWRHRRLLQNFPGGQQKVR